MNAISNNMQGYLRADEAYRTPKAPALKNTAETETQQYEQKDSVQFSDEGLAALKNSIMSRTKGVIISKSGEGCSVQFNNPAYVYRAVKNGYIDIDGEQLVLSDKDKAALKKAADDSFNQMQKDTLQAAAEHNAHVMQQQMEAIMSAGEGERGLLEMFLRNDDEKEWKSPLLELETHSVSMDLQKTGKGFSVSAVCTAVVDDFA